MGHAVAEAAGKVDEKFIFKVKLNISILIILCKGVFLVTTTIAFVSFERYLSMKTDSSISTVPQGSERGE